MANNSSPILSSFGSVNKNELTSIKALASYVAHNIKVPEEVINNHLLAEFNVCDVHALRRDDYERAIRLLVDLQVDLIIN